MSFSHEKPTLPIPELTTMPSSRSKESYFLTHSVHSAWLIFILVKISPEVLNATWNIQLLCSSETAQTIPYEDGAL